MQRGTPSSPIQIDDSEEEVIEELCNPSADSSLTEDLSMRLTDPSPPEAYHTSTPSSHKRKRAEMKTDYSDTFIQGSSSAPILPQSPVVEGRKARKRRRRFERQALGAAEMFARAQEFQRWHHQMSSVLFDPVISTHAMANNTNMNMMGVFTGPGTALPVYPSQDILQSYIQAEPGSASDWVSAMALAGSLPGPNTLPNQYQWPPPHDLPRSHASQKQPQPETPSILAPSPSLSPPALLERVSSPTTSIINRLPPAAPQAYNHANAHFSPPKRPHHPPVQIIGLKPDNEPQSKHGVFRFSAGNLSYFLPNSNKKPGNVGHFKNTHPQYIPNPACTVVMEQLPKTYRTIDFVKTWARESSGVFPVCIFVDAPSAKALVEFPSAKFARKAWESPRLGAEYAGLKPHQLKGKPRVDLIKVWWYRVEGVGAGAGVGEIEEGEIEDDEMPGYKDRREQYYPVQHEQGCLGPQVPTRPRHHQRQAQAQQQQQRQNESKKARKAKLAKEKQAKKVVMMAVPGQNQDESSSGLGLGLGLGLVSQNAQSGMADVTNIDVAVVSAGSAEPSVSPQLTRVECHRSVGRSVSPPSPSGPVYTEGAEVRPRLLDDMTAEVDDVSPITSSREASLARQLRVPGRFGNSPHRGSAGNAGRPEVVSHLWSRSDDGPLEPNEDFLALSREVSLVRRLHDPDEAVSTRAGTGTSAEGDSSTSATRPSSSVREIPSSVTFRTPVTLASPPSLTALNTTAPLDYPDLASRKTYQYHRMQGTPSTVDTASRPIIPLPPSPPSNAAVTATSIFSPPSSSESPSSSRSRPSQRVQSSESPALSLSAAQVTPLREPGNTKLTSEVKVMSKPPQPASVPVPSTATASSSRPGTAIPERQSSGARNGLSATSASTSLTEMKRVLMAKQKELEEKIAKSKIEMIRLKGQPNEAMPLSSGAATAEAEDNKAMEDRLRNLVLQSQKSRSRGADQPTSSQSSSVSTSAAASPLVVSSPPVLTPPATLATGCDAQTMSSAQNFSLEDLAVSFITETISMLKYPTSPSTISPPDIPATPPVPLVPPVSASQPQLPSSSIQTPTQAQNQSSAPLPNGTGSSIKEDLSARQRRLEQYITESKGLMTQLAQARTKQEKDRLLALMREKTRLMDKEKEQMASIANGTTVSTKDVMPQQQLVTQHVSQQVVFKTRWPTGSLDAGMIIIMSDDESEDEE